MKHRPARLPANPLRGGAQPIRVASEKHQVRAPGGGEEPGELQSGVAVTAQDRDLHGQKNQPILRETSAVSGAGVQVAPWSVTSGRENRRCAAAQGFR